MVRFWLGVCWLIERSPRTVGFESVDFMDFEIIRICHVCFFFKLEYAMQKK